MVISLIKTVSFIAVAIAIISAIHTSLMTLPLAISGTLSMLAFLFFVGYIVKEIIRGIIQKITKPFDDENSISACIVFFIGFSFTLGLIVTILAHMIR